MFSLLPRSYWLYLKLFLCLAIFFAFPFPSLRVFSGERIARIVGGAVWSLGCIDHVERIQRPNESSGDLTL